MTGLCVVLCLGLFLDARGHLHGQVDNVVFTASHATLYGGVVLIGAMLAASVGRDRTLGYSWRHSLPRGYGLSLFGVVLFLSAGVVDLTWHSVFGLETGFGAVLSPSHLGIALAGGLMVSGPIRAVGQARGWVRLGPTVLAAALLLGWVAVFTVYAHPLVGIFAARNPPSAAQPGTVTQPLGVASIVLQSAVLMGVLLVLLFNWRLPRGALTLLITVPSIEVIGLSDQYGLLPTVILAGAVAEVLYWLLQPTDTSTVRTYVFAFSVPVAFYGLYMLTLQLNNGLGWTIHIAVGSVLAAGLTGFLMASLLLSCRRTCRGSGDEATSV